MAIKPFTGTNGITERTVYFTYLGAEDLYTETSWNYFSVLEDNKVLATECTKREAWTFCQGYTKRHPKAHVLIVQDLGTHDLWVTEGDTHVVWSTLPEEVGSER